MQTPNIKSHNVNRHYEMPHFFVLSKGNNAGRPLDKPCPNCFVIITSNEEEKNRLYWLCFGLWQGRHFHQLLTGSVIPFIRITEFKKCLDLAVLKVAVKPAEFKQTIESLIKLNHHQQNIKKQLILMNELKITIIRKALQ